MTCSLGNNVLETAIPSIRNPIHGKYNKSTFFILPWLGISHTSVDVYPFFVNTFLKMEGYETEQYPLFLLAKTKDVNSVAYKFFEELLVKKPEYVHHRLVGEHNGDLLFVFVFDLSNHAQDYDLVLQGKYSKVSYPRKLMYPNKLKFNGLVKEGFAHGIANKTVTKVKEFAKLIASDEEEELQLIKILQNADELLQPPDNNLEEVSLL